MDLLRDLALPETDAGVAAQLAVTLLLWLAGLWWAWDRAEIRLVVVGAGLVAIGLIGVRALH